MVAAPHPAARLSAELGRGARERLAWALSSGAVSRLNDRWQELHREPPPDAVSLAEPGPGGEETEVLVLGGGLGLLAAAALQLAGRAVTLVDRATVGATHREWNSSRAELAALDALGLAASSAVVAEYRTGFVEFAHRPPGGPPPARTWLPGVLDAAISSDRLLGLARERFLAAGGRLREGEAFRRLTAGPRAARVDTDGGTYRARVVVDAMGVLSPVQFWLHRRPYDWVCPTVGTVARGLAGVDAGVGEILVTDRPAEPDGRQLIWELFPLPGDRAAAYLFHFAPVGEEGRLESLFADYFRALPAYHDDADAEHLKPVFGLIPSRHRARAASLPRVVPVGDAAGWSSPLTFTGFGSFARNLPRVADLLLRALDRDLLGPEHTRRISARQANLELLPPMARFMRPLPADPDSVNRIVDAFNRATVDLGIERARTFYRDRAGSLTFLALLARVWAHYPGVWRHALARLGPAGVARLVGAVGWVGLRELMASAADVTLPAAEARLPAALAFAWRAAALEHRAMRPGDPAPPAVPGSAGP